MIQERLVPLDAKCVFSSAQNFTHLKTIVVICEDSLLGRVCEKKKATEQIEMPAGL